MSREVKIGARFYCVIGQEKALLEVVHPYLSPVKKDLLCCRIVTGSLCDDQGTPHGPGAVTDMPADRVAAAVARYNAKTPAALPDQHGAVSGRTDQPKGKDSTGRLIE